MRIITIVGIAVGFILYAQTKVDLGTQSKGVAPGSVSSLQNPNIAIGANGDISTSGDIKTGIGSVFAGASTLGQGQWPNSFPENSFSLVGPLVIPSPYQWRVPTADSAGAIVSDGRGTPGTLSIVPGLSVVKTVKGSDGNDCTITWVQGVMTATTCP
jgi:hypothetical protein